ncbi:MAG: GNAT family N-acetyltransferase [Candidatus Eremiobacteraeota bacterium]|nr:GNAT family N-acetyltransferase [Candidatus Eremiobacteraeota bacterium]MBV8461578.1 GNAT family N-acetyltransferase [Candidatus Eremiobacteraeota bacterium]MBV8595958.1 GNAT family N-acetyltransferase [Candidatus Eremiobacteraeota bacterium]
MSIEPVILEGNAVRLEPLRRDHHQALCAVGLDPALWRLNPTQALSPEQMTDRIEELLAAQAAGTDLPFVTVERASNSVVGATRYMNIDRPNKRVEIGGTWIARPWQRTAINTEAKYLMLRHAFETWGCIRVELKTDALNEQSRAAILRIGAREEGILRRHLVTWTGRVRDTVYFSVLDDEWPRVKAELEHKMRRGTNIGS